MVCSVRREVGGHADEYLGVRYRGYTVEVKKWFNLPGGHKPKSVGFYKEDKRLCKRSAALLYDFVRKCEDPALAKDKLNNAKVVRQIQREQGVVEEDLSERGLQCLEEWMTQHPPMHGREAWESLDDEQMKKLKDDIMEQALAFDKHLEDTIRGEISRAGCQWRDLDEILPPVLGFDPIQELDETGDLLRKKDAELVSLKAANEALEAKYAELEARKMCWCQGVFLPGQSPQMQDDDLSNDDFDASNYNSVSQRSMLDDGLQNDDFDASNYNSVSQLPMQDDDLSNDDFDASNYNSVSQRSMLDDGLQNDDFDASNYNSVSQLPMQDDDLSNDDYISLWADSLVSEPSTV